MSYQVMARKWRPQSFDTVIGQEHVIAALKHTLKNNSLHHAILLTGTRGTGKTTLARIIAKSLNCQTNHDGNPCQTCSACTQIQSGSYIDLIEVDAASRTKVEDTRELLENVNYAPSQGRYKIYLIDEVHMLSNHSFNALLKTLEEPPEHVKFLFATTDPQKMPMTVLSRCLQLHLKPLTKEQIADSMAASLSQDKIQYDPSALDDIAVSANGSMRDALSLLEQAVALGGGAVTPSATTTLLGTIPAKTLHALIQSILAQDATKTLANISNLKELGVDFMQVLDQMLTLIHKLSMHYFSSDAPAPIDTQNCQAWQSLSNTQQQEFLQLIYQIGLKAKQELPYAPTEYIGFEMTILRMLAFYQKHISLEQAPTNTITTQITNTSNTTEQPAEPPNNTTSAKNIHNHSKSAKNAANSTNTEHNGIITQANWLQICGSLPVQGMTKAILQHTSFENVQDNIITLAMEPQQAPMLNDKHIERIQTALEQTGFKYKIIINVGTMTNASPHQISTSQQVKQQAATNEKSKNNPVVKNLLDTFDATIVKSTYTSETE